MDRSTFGTLALAAFGLVLASFVVLGLSRILLGYRTALLLAAPIGVVASVLVVVLFVRSLLAATGVAPLGNGGDGPG